MNTRKKENVTHLIITHPVKNQQLPTPQDNSRPINPLPILIPLLLLLLILAIHHQGSAISSLATLRRHGHRRCEWRGGIGRVGWNSGVGPRVWDRGAGVWVLVGPRPWVGGIHSSAGKKRSCWCCMQEMSLRSDRMVCDGEEVRP